jgi:cold shock CspA family protein
LNIFQKAAQVIEHALAGMSSGNLAELSKSKEFTESALNIIAPNQSNLTPHAIAAEAAANRETGIVKWFKGSYGFITDSNQNDLFVHFTEIRGHGFRELFEGQNVVFTPRKSEKGLIALNVEII